MRATLTRDLLLVVGLALIVRLARLVFLAPVVEVEGSEYGRIAENLLAGNGYVGLIEGPELMLPPLFPVAIAAMSWLTGADVVLAGRLVSLLAGLVTIVALYLIGMRCGGRRVALWTGLCAATLPGLVLSSTAVFSEGLLVAGLSLATLFFMIAVQNRTAVPGLLAGLCFGLAYLTRIESIGIAPVAVLLLLVKRPEGRKRSGRLAAAALVLGFLIAALPYPVYLENATGRLGFAGKSQRVFATIERFSQGMKLPEANYALGAQGELEGPWLTPNEHYEGASLVEIVGRSPGPITSYLFDNVVRTTWMLVSGKGVLSLFFLVAFVLAWRAPGRSQQVRALDLFLLWLCLYVCAVASVYKVLLRYVIPLAIPAAVWGTRGLFEAMRRRSHWRQLVTPQRVLVAGMALLILSTCRGFFTGFAEFDEANREPNSAVLELGAWLRNQADEDAIVMASDSRVPFYGGRQWIPLPVTRDVETLRAYARTTGARYISLEIPPRGIDCVRPGQWFDATNPAGMKLRCQSRNLKRALFEFD